MDINDVVTCSFIDNSSIFNGGSAYMGGALNFKFCNFIQFTNTTFTNNSATFGGAIAIIPGPNSFRKIVLIYSNCTFINNYGLVSTFAIYILEKTNLYV